MLFLQAPCQCASGTCNNNITPHINYLVTVTLAKFTSHGCHVTLLTMTLFINGRFLRNLITPTLLAHSRRSLKTRNSLSTRLNTTLLSRNESSLSSTITTRSTPLLEQMEPKLSLTFTCTVSDCGERSTHQFTKRAYQKGVVLVQCPGCKNRYVLSQKKKTIILQTKRTQMIQSFF